MAQTLKALVAPPSPEALPGGLLNSAIELGGSWQRGVVFQTPVCVTGHLWPFCGTSSSGAPEAKETGDTNEGAEFESVGTYAVVDCSTLGGVDPEFARAGLRIQAETQLAAELAAGATTGNPALADATSIGSSADAVEALSLLEGGLADVIGNVRGTVHVSPQVLTLLYAEGAVRENLNGTFNTPNGHVLIASPGYADLTGIHGTGPVYANHEPAVLLQDVERSQNTLTVRAEGIGIAAFDPCANIVVDLGGS